MNRRAKILLGICLILVGVFWMLNELGLTIITYTGLVSAIEYLWPVVFIAIGLTMVFPGRAIKLCVWSGLIILFLAGSIFATRKEMVEYDNTAPEPPYFDSETYLDM